MGLSSEPAISFRVVIPLNVGLVRSLVFSKFSEVTLHFMFAV